MRRLLAGTTAFVALTGVVLVLPVYAEPAPGPQPVQVRAEEVALGSFEAPAPAAEVQEGATDPVAGVADTAAVLTVRETDVDAFSLVAVSWAHDPAVTDPVINVRVRDDGGTWSPWTEMGPEDAEQDDPVNPVAELRGGTEPLWTGPGTGVEVELVTRSGAQPSDVRVELIDPGQSVAEPATEAPEIQDTADAAVAIPPVYSRAQWGADETLMGWDPEYPSTIKAATLHHTAGSNNYTADQVDDILRGIYHYHAVTRGWGDIGYNVLVDKFGRIWEGRAGGLASTVVGAHAGGFNTSTFGVSMMGDYDAVDTPERVLGNPLATRC